MAFTLYPVGHLPYGREPFLSQSPEGGESPRASLVGAAVAACRGELWPEELIEDESGPVRRTRARRISRVASVTGLDEPRVGSLILGTKSYPEARGCLERFNRTLAEQLLCGWPGNPAVDPELMALELRIEHWATEMYNHTPHEGLEGETPAERFHGDSRSLTVPESQVAIDEAFVTSFKRTVKSHNCISVGGILWEAPLGHRGQRVDVYRNMITGVLSVLHQGERVALSPADLTANAYQKRSATKAKDPAPSKPRRTAADAAFERDHPPLVDDDGGYQDTD